MPLSISGNNLIAGKESRAGRKTFTGVNPYLRKPGSQTFYNATEIEVDQSVQAAREAYAFSRNYSSAKLAAFLDQVAIEIENLGDQLIETADQETGLGATRLTGERVRTTGQLRKFANYLREGSYVEAVIDTALPDRQPTPRPSIRRMLVPIGPVAVFPASNFPFAFGVSGGDTASAFAAGCSVVVKGHPSHPATAELFGHAINRAIKSTRLPPGFFSLLQGDQIAVGQYLVTHPGITAVGFTGSLRGGRAIYDSASSRPTPIPVYAEMGSVNPVILLPGAVRERSDTIVNGLFQSITLGAGQFCTNPGLVFVIDGPETGALIENLSQMMASQKPGVLLNARIEADLNEKVTQTLGHPEVELLTGGEQIIDRQHYCYANTLMRTDAKTFRRAPSLQNEHFGAVSLVVVCGNYDELSAAIRALHGNLTASIHAADDELEKARDLYDQLREKVGRLIWNGFPTGVEVVHAMQHGGPYPATTAPESTSVGMLAIRRFLRPVAYQGLPDALLPEALRDANPLRIMRKIDDQWTRNPIP